MLDHATNLVLQTCTSSKQLCSNSAGACFLSLCSSTVFDHAGSGLSSVRTWWQLVFYRLPNFGKVVCKVVGWDHRTHISQTQLDILQAQNCRSSSCWQTERIRLGSQGVMSSGIWMQSSKGTSSKVTKAGLSIAMNSITCRPALIRQYSQGWWAKAMLTWGR